MAIIIAVLLFFIPAFPYMSERYSAYEEYAWYESLNSASESKSSYPLEIEQSGVSFENNYFRFLKNKMDFEKTFDSRNLFLDAVIGASYADGFNKEAYISPRAQFEMSDNLTASVKVFISTDTENSRGFSIKPFKDAVIAGFERGYVKYSNGRILLLFGRIDCHSSYSPDRSLLFDYSAPPMDGILLRGRINKSLVYEFKYLSLGSMRLDSAYIFEGESVDYVKRFLAFHKLTFSLRSWLSLSFSESCIFGRASTGNPLDYAFPFFVFYGEQNNIDINDNILWSFDANYNFLGKANLSYSFLVDDYQYEYEGTKDLEPPELGHIIRIDAPFCCAVASVSYIRVNAWVYNQRYPWNRYVYNGKNIGTELGPDIQGIEASFRPAYSADGRAKVYAAYFQKGDNYSSSDWVFPITDPYYYYTQIGIAPVSKWGTFSAGFEHICRFLTLSGEAGYNYGIEEHESGFFAGGSIRISI